MSAANERTIRHVFFVLKDGSVADRGDTVELSKEDIERGESLGAFVSGSAPADSGVFDAAAFVAEATVDDVVERAEANPSEAQAILDAEKAGKDRKTAVEPLEALIAGQE